LCSAVFSDGYTQLRWAKAVQATKQTAHSLLQGNKMLLDNSNQRKRAAQQLFLG
jgi:hypothetical protein